MASRPAMVFASGSNAPKHREGWAEMPTPLFLEKLMKTPIRHKVQFDVDEEVSRELQATLPWGSRRHVFEALTISMLAYIRREGPARAIGLLMTGGAGVSTKEGADGP